MGSPYNIAGSASGLFFQNRASAEYQALSVIAESLAHPQRTLLSSFVQQAVDKEYASRFLLDEVYGQDKATLFEFLATWISLLKKGTSLRKYSNVAKVCSQYSLLFAKT